VERCLACEADRSGPAGRGPRTTDEHNQRLEIFSHCARDRSEKRAEALLLDAPPLKTRQPARTKARQASGWWRRQSTSRTKYLREKRKSLREPRPTNPSSLDIRAGLIRSLLELLIFVLIAVLVLVLAFALFLAFGVPQRLFLCRCQK
jgi:hypothetical protein